MAPLDSNGDPRMPIPRMPPEGPFTTGGSSIIFLTPTCTRELSHLLRLASCRKLFHLSPSGTVLLRFLAPRIELIPAVVLNSRAIMPSGKTCFTVWGAAVEKYVGRGGSGL